MTKVNEGRPGYKETKIGWIPEEWGFHSLKEISPKITDGEHATPKRVSSGFFLLSARNIKNGYIDLNDVDYVDESEFKRIFKRCNPEPTDIIISCSGTIGRACVVPKDLKFVMVRSGALIKKNNNVFNSFYLYNCIVSPFGQNQIQKYLNKGAQPNLFINHIEKLRFPLPPLPEQKKIAEFLSTWDEAIEKLEKLVELKEKRKKGLMSKILTGEKRLQGAQEKWEQLHLHDILKSQIRPIPKPDKPFLSLGIRSHCKGTFHKPEFDPNKIAMDTLYEVKTNDLIINITFAWEGAVAIADKKDNGGLVSHRFPTYQCRKKVDISFLRHWILLPNFRYKLGLISPGGAGRNRVLNKKDLLKLRIFLPNIEEQKQIGKLLDTADIEISTLKNHLQSIKTQKRGLMQKLLTGEIRVKV